MKEFSKSKNIFLTFLVFSRLSYCDSTIQKTFVYTILLIEEHLAVEVKNRYFFLSPLTHDFKPVIVINVRGVWTKDVSYGVDGVDPPSATPNSMQMQSHGHITH